MEWWHRAVALLSLPPAPRLMAVPSYPCRNQAVRHPGGAPPTLAATPVLTGDGNLKMRGHFWVGDELYCEKHALASGALQPHPPWACLSPPLCGHSRQTQPTARWPGCDEREARGWDLPVLLVRAAHSPGLCWILLRP